MEKPEGDARQTALDRKGERFWHRKEEAYNSVIGTFPILLRPCKPFFGGFLECNINYLKLHPFSILLLFLRIGIICAAGVAVLGLIRIWLAWKVKTNTAQKIAYQFFGFSILYLMLLFVLMMIR